MVTKFLLISIGILPVYFLLLKIISKKSGVDLKKLFKFFCWGVLSTVPFILISKLGISGHYLNAKLGIALTILVLALMEEFSKYSIFFFIKKEKRPKPVVYAIVALGFAYLENVAYISSSIEYLIYSASGIGVLIFRVVLGSLAHVAFTTINGMLSVLPVKSIALKPIGITAASTFHYTYNTFCEYNLTILLPPLLVVCFVIISKLNKKINAKPSKSGTARKKMQKSKN
jgi:RsiW-degrading membrane proteinase PrsW (M82 family)